MGGREAFGAAAAAPRGKSEDGRSPRALPKLPSELLGLCLSYSTRWSAVACSQVVCKRWRSLCRGPQVSLRPLLVVTLSGRSALLVLDGSGGVRCSLPAAPWRRGCRVAPWGEARDALGRVASNAVVERRGHQGGAVYEDWPTCTLATPRRLYVSQYRVSGVLAYAVQEDGRLAFHATLASRVLEYPEGLAALPGGVGKELLYVCTCNGVVASVDAETGAVLRSISVGDHMVAWNMISHGRSLYVTAHAPGPLPWYEDATTRPTGVVFKCDVDVDAPSVVGPPRPYATGLNRPSGLAFLGDGTLLVTSYREARAPRGKRHWLRAVAEYAAPPGRKKKAKDDTDAEKDDAPPPLWREASHRAASNRPWGLVALDGARFLTCGRGSAPLFRHDANDPPDAAPTALLSWDALKRAIGDGDKGATADANVIILA